MAVTVILEGASRERCAMQVSPLAELCATPHALGEAGHHPGSRDRTASVALLALPDATPELAAQTPASYTGYAGAGAETRVGRRQFLPLPQAGGVDVVTMDVQWSGGLTEARKVAALAGTYAVPVAPHDCTGPASLAA